MTIIERGSIPEPNTGCWLWTGPTRQPQPYGVIRNRKGKLLYAHRVSYELYKGPIPSDREIDHVCKNKSCVNPDHLEAVTHAENMRRAYSLTECKHGHLLTEDNLYVVRRSNGLVHKRCKICHIIRNSKHQKKRGKLWAKE